MARGLLISALFLLGTSYAAGAKVEIEWSGIFKVADAKHTWSMQQVGGKYADQTMKLVVIPVTTIDDATMDAKKSDGQTLIDGTCTVVEDGGSMTPAAAGSCFDLHVGTGATSTFSIDTSGLSGVAFYAQHIPTEFEKDRHYLYDSANKDIEPVAQEGGGAHGHSHDHAHDKCECKAVEAGWTIDCANMPPVEAAVKYLTDNCKNTDQRKTAKCINSYQNFQAHHDHCPHDTLPATLEGILHVHEEFYDDCFIKRQYDASLSKCPAVTCSDKAAMSAATKYLYDNCNSTATCKSSATCKTNFQLILMAHDTCEESDLPGALEVGLHDHEDYCASVLCNTADAPFDLTCPTDVASGARPLAVAVVLLISAALML